MKLIAANGRRETRQKKRKVATIEDDGNYSNLCKKWLIFWEGLRM